MFASYEQMRTYEPPKNQGPSKVYRFPLYKRRPAPEPVPAPPAPPVEKPPKEETPAPPAATWSEWQYITDPQWEGYWRASALDDDGGWHYHLTKDGKTVWEKKVPSGKAPKPEAPKSTTASANSAAESQSASPAALKKQLLPSPPTDSSARTVATAPLTRPPPASPSAAPSKGSIPSYTVKKPEPPSPALAPKKITGTITLRTKSGKSITVPLPDPGQPLVIRPMLER